MINLYGELTGFESICHLICSNKFKTSIVSIPSPFEQNSIIELLITKKKSTKRTVKLVGSSPMITCDVSLSGTVLSMGKKINISSEENLKLIGEYASSFLKEKILNYLYKTSKDLHCDIDSFGKHLYSKYLTISDFEKLNWLNIYKDSYFDVNISVSVNSSNLIIKD